MALQMLHSCLVPQLLKVVFVSHFNEILTSHIYQYLNCVEVFRFTFCVNELPHCCLPLS